MKDRRRKEHSALTAEKLAELTRARDTIEKEEKEEILAKLREFKRRSKKSNEKE